MKTLVDKDTQKFILEQKKLAKQENKEDRSLEGWTKIILGKKK